MGSDRLQLAATKGRFLTASHTIAVAATILCATWHTESFASTTQTCKPPEIKIQTDYSTPWTEYVDVATLNKRHQHRGGGLWLGSTTNQLKTSIIASVTQQNQAPECPEAEILVMLSLAKHDVSLASELKGMSCLHKEVAQHEQQHVSANRKALEDMKPLVEKELHDSITAFSKTHKKTSSFQTRLAKYLNTEMAPKIQIMWNEKGKVHEKIDSPEEYKRILTACKDDAVKMNEVLTSKGL